MNSVTIVIITFVITLSFYLFFFVLGLGGVAKNRKAQGLDHKANK